MYRDLTSSSRMIFLYLINSEKMETMRLSNEKEVDALQEQAKRLQVQLNNGYTAFADYKKKKSEEIAALELKLEEAKSSTEVNRLEGASYNQVENNFF